MPGAGGYHSDENTEHCVCQIIRDCDIAVVVYTDGSVTDGIRNGGAAMVATTGDPAYPVIIHSEERRGAAFTSSFNEEKEVMSMAVSKLTGQGVHLF